MAYDKAQLEKKALSAIKKNKLKRINHLVPFLPCNRATFYNLELDKLDTITAALESNRTAAKINRLDAWEQSENPTLQLAFYKLIADEDEVEILNGSKQKIDHSGETKITVEYVTANGSTENSENKNS